MKKFVLGIIISGLFIVLLLRQVDLDEVIKNLQHIQYLFILAAIGVHTAGFYLRAYRWKYLVESLGQGQADLPTFFSISSVGYMLNNLLPLRLGDVTKSLILAKKLDMSKSTLLATVIIEKITDGLSLVLILSVSFLFIPIPSQIKTIFVVLCVIFTVPVVGLFFINRYKQYGKGMFEKLPYSSKITPFIKNFWIGLGTSNSVSKNTILMLISILIWIVEGLMVYCVVLAMSINLDVLASIFVTSVTNLGVIIPSAPGYVGPFEFFMTLSASVFGVAANLGASLAIVTHLTQWLPVTVIGIIIILMNPEMLALLTKTTKKGSRSE